MNGDRLAVNVLEDLGVPQTRSRDFISYLLALVQGHSTVLSIAVIFSASFVVRLWGLTYHSLWLDETLSLPIAKLSVSEIIVTGFTLDRVPHPPLYYLLLHWWMAALGDGEIALRLSSAFIGAMLCPVIFLIARPWGLRTAWIAAILAAINPGLVWYSQEVRMYSLLTLFGTAASLSLLRALREDRWLWWLVYGVFLLASVYTHLFGAFLFPIHFLLMLFCVRTSLRQLRQLRKALLTFFIVVLLYIPWLYQLLTNNPAKWDNGRLYLNLLQMAERTLYFFSVRWLPDRSVEDSLPMLIAIALLVSSGLSYYLVVKNNEDARRLALLSFFYLVVPLPPILIASSRTPVFQERYLLVFAPALLLGLAAGVTAIWRRTTLGGVLALQLVILLSLWGLSGDWNQQDLKEDWRATAQYLETNASKDDLIIAHVDYVQVPLKYYYHGSAPVATPFYQPVVAGEVSTKLGDLKKYRTIWLVEAWSGGIDPDSLVEKYFAGEYPLVEELHPAGITVKRYAVNSQ